MVGTATEWNNYSLMSQMINDTTCTVEAPLNYCRDKDRRVPRFDDVERPQHYNSGKVEAIEAIKASMSHEEYLGYLKGNTIKYLWRYRYKGKPLQDLNKAQWYLNKLKEEHKQ